MNIPKSIKIGGHIWEIKYPYMFKERLDRYAFCDDAQKTIGVTDRDGNGNLRANSSITVSFIHELLHAMDHLTGQNIFGGDFGENKIEALSEVIYQILVDNGYLEV